MLKTAVTIVGLIGISMATAWIMQSRQDGISVYTIPKEFPKPQSVPAAPHTTPLSAAQLEYTLPENWSEQTGSSMGETSFQVTLDSNESIEASFLPFQNMLGREALVVNIWREQIGLDHATEAEILAGAADTSVGQLSGKVYDLQNPKLDNEFLPQRMRVVMVHRGGMTWFFKLVGGIDQVEKAKPSFARFLASVSFPANTMPTAATAPPVTMPPATGMAGGSNLPQWDVPEGWTPTAAGPMIDAAFTAVGGTKITVSSLSGTAGGLLANVNRWRRQISLPPIDNAQLEADVQTMELGTNTGHLVDMVQTTGDPRQRIVALVVPQTNKTWFYKLTGTDASVESVKAEFTAFVKSVRY